MPASTRYHQQELIAEGGEVKTFRGRDPLNGLPVRIYRFPGEPTAQPGEVHSSYIPALLSSSLDGGAGQVVTIFSHSYRPVEAPVPAHEVEALLQQTASALDDAAEAGVVHGDLSPERLFYVNERHGNERHGNERQTSDDDQKKVAIRRYLLEGYGVPWGVRASEYNPPERIEGASYAGDIFSWAMTMRALTGPLPGGLRDLLSSCLDADPQSRPHAHEVRAALASYRWRDSAPNMSNTQIKNVQPNEPVSEPAGDVEAEDTQENTRARESEPLAKGAPHRREHVLGVHPVPTEVAPIGVHIPHSAEADPRDDEGNGDLAASNPESSSPRVRVHPDTLERFAATQFSTEGDEDDTFDDLQNAFAHPSSAQPQPLPTAIPVRVIQEGAQRGGPQNRQNGWTEQKTIQRTMQRTEQAEGSEAPLSADALRRVDATPEYERRRAHFEAQQRGMSAPLTDSAGSARARLQQSLGNASSPPEQTADRATDPPETESADTEGKSNLKTDSSHRSVSRTNVRVRTFRPKSDVDDDVSTHMGEGDDFDDIDDRGPDPTAVRGGRRVLLLSLLVIAVFVLLALLLFNP